MLRLNLDAPGDSLPARFWNDTGCRAALITAVLVFLLETLVNVAGASSAIGGTIGWATIIISIAIIGRLLTFRPYSGSLRDAANRSLALTMLLFFLAEIIIDWSDTLSWTFASEPIYWPFSALLCPLPFLARFLASRLDDPLDRWFIFFAFVNFWFQAAMWKGAVWLDSPALVWAIMLIGAAVIARWFVGGGFSGPMKAPLNLTVALFAFLLLWLEYGAERSGASAVWVQQVFFWPWMLWTLGLALGCRLVAPHLSRRLIQGAEEDSIERQ